MTASPKVFYYCHNNENPRGGEKHSYRHVNILNQAGIPAFVLHRQEGFRYTWFDNQTPTVGFETFAREFDLARDFLVLPEDLVHKARELPGKKVMFNKNVYYGFPPYSVSMAASLPYLLPEVVATMTISEHNRRHLSFAFPQHPIFNVLLGIDLQAFTYRPLAGKKRQIAFVTKRPHAIGVVVHTLEARAHQGLNALSNFSYVFLERLTEAQAIEVMQDSLVLVFLNLEEGLGRVSLEAMACGALVASIAAAPMNECLLPYSCFAADDLVGIAEMIERVAADFPAALGPWDALSQQGRALAERHSHELQAASVLSVWEQLFSRFAGPAPA